MGTGAERIDLFTNHPAEKLCGLLRLDGGSTNRFERISPPEWASVVSNAMSFGLAPLLYIHLKQSGRLEAIEASLVKILRESYRNSSAKGVLRRYHLKTVILKLQENGIRVLLLKGSHLVEEIYRDPALRPMFDLDLLVPRSDLDRASQVLEEMGYQARKSFFTEFVTTVSHQLPLFEKPGHSPIELHWTIISPELHYRIDPDELWQRARPIEFAGSPVMVLDREDFILHLAVHAAVQHKLTGGLRLIYDVAATLNAYGSEVDWARLASRSDGWGAAASLYLILDLCQTIFGSPLPRAFMDSIRPADYDATWRDTALELLFVNPSEHPEFSKNLAQFVQTGRIDEKVRYALGRIFPSPTEMAEKFPVLPDSPRLWLYYPVYFVNLLKKHLGSIVGVARKTDATMDAVKFASSLREREDYLDNRLMG